MEVATWICAPSPDEFGSSLDLVPNYDVSVLGNEGGSPYHMQVVIHKVLGLD